MSGLHGDVKVNVNKTSDVTYQANYTAYMQGMYLVHVTYADKQVSGSPFKVVVHPSVNSQAVEAFGPGLKEGVIGQPIKFGVDTRAAVPGELKLHCMGPKKEAKVDVIDNCDGTYSVNLQPKEPGKHVLEIKYDNEHIQNSPYLVRISGPPDPSKCRVYGPGLEHGVLSTFKGDFVCDTKGAGAGQLKVRVHGPKGGFKVDMHRDTSKDRTIVVRYNPTEPGDYKIEVWWADVEIPQSPFEVKIFNTHNDLEDFLLEYPQERNKHPAVTNGSISSSHRSQFSLPNGSSSLDSEKYWKADV
ncbi:filamin-B-like [Convolutriloba macropyga]|uniref:filamin-B-like n=1 Tax=Convolutriloba macropyga TaxID=536237 RepID=UPI003F522FEE